MVALNRFTADSDVDLKAVLEHCRRQGVEAALSEGYVKGGDGMTDLADRVVAAASTSSPDAVQPIYTADQSLEEKITTIATKVYGAGQVAFKPAAKSRLQRLAALGYHRLPVCIAKTQYSFSDDPTVMGAPQGWTLTISDVTLSAGAGFVVAIAGSMMLMPGLGQDAPGAEARRGRCRAGHRHGILTAPPDTRACSAGDYNSPLECRWNT